MGYVSWGMARHVHSSDLALEERFLNDMLLHHRFMVFQSRADQPNPGLCVQREENGTIIDTAWLVEMDTVVGKVHVLPGRAMDRFGRLVWNPELSEPVGPPGPGTWTMYVRWAERTRELGYITVDMDPPAPDPTRRPRIVGVGTEFSKFREGSTWVRIDGATNPQNITVDYLGNPVAISAKIVQIVSDTEMYLDGFNRHGLPIDFALETNLGLTVVGDWFNFNQLGGYPQSPDTDEILHYDHRYFGFVPVGTAIPNDAFVLATVTVSGAGVVTSIEDRREENIIRFNPYFVRQMIAPMIPLSVTATTGLDLNLRLETLPTPGSRVLRPKPTAATTGWIKVVWGLRGSGGTGNPDSFTVSPDPGWTVDALKNYYLVDKDGNKFEIESNSNDTLAVHGHPAGAGGPNDTWEISSGASSYSVVFRFWRVSYSPHGAEILTPEERVEIVRATGDLFARQNIIVHGLAIALVTEVQVMAHDGPDRLGDSDWSLPPQAVTVGLSDMTSLDMPSGSWTLFVP